MKQQIVGMAVAGLACLAGLSAQRAQAGVVLSFEGTSQLDNCALNGCFRPPDTMGAVGTTQYLETSNGSVTVYDKASGAVVSRVGMNAFWQSVGQTGSQGDQRVLFDHYTNRWIAIGFGATVDTINIAVSDTSNALGTWKSTAFLGVPAGGIADYPTLSLDDKGVYIATNNFNGATPSVFTGTSLRTIPKADLFNGAPSTNNMTAFTTPSTGSPPDNGYAIQAALNWGGNPSNTTAVMAASLLANNQVFYKVNGVNAPGATVTASSYIGGVGYADPRFARQPDGTRLVDTLGDRISANVVQFNGRLYSVHTVRPTGTDYDAVRWTEIDAVTGALIAEGDISSLGFDFFQGSIAVNEFGEVVIGYNRSGGADKGIDGRISFMARTYTLDAFGALVEVGPEYLLRRSDADNYRCGSLGTTTPDSEDLDLGDKTETDADAGSIDTTCRQRWGDYSAVTFDPTNHHEFWAIGEYAAASAVVPGFTTDARSIWHTYIAELTVFDVPEPGTMALLAVGLVAFGASRRSMRRASVSNT